MRMMDMVVMELDVFQNASFTQLKEGFRRQVFMKNLFPSRTFIRLSKIG
jgi:hypothetical protein